MKRLLFFLTVATLVSCGRTFEQRTAKYAEVGSVNDNRAAVLDINEGVGRWGYVDGTTDWPPCRSPKGCGAI